MALPSTLYRFHIQLSDVDRGLYQPLELRIAMHPSEALGFLLTRVIAYSLNVQDGIALTQGIGDPDEPAIRVTDLTGITRLWIDVGNPSAKRLHKAAKVSKNVRIYTYRDPQILKGELQGQEVYRKESIELFAVAPHFLQELATTLERDNHWQLLHTEGELAITVRDKTIHGEIIRHPLV